MTCHYAEELQDVLDGRLAPERRAEIESHLRECDACASVYERLRWARDAIGKLEDIPLPEDLPARVAAAFDREDQSSAGVVRSGFPPTRMGRQFSWWALPLAAALVIAAGAALWRFQSAPTTEIPAALAGEFSRYEHGALSLALSTDDIPRLEAFFKSANLDFVVRVLDLDMMGYRPLGANVIDVDSRRAAMLVYRSGTGFVLCIMYRGDAAADGRGGEVRTNSGIEFYVHRVGGKTVVLWQEGPVTCGLVGEGDPQAVIDLAFAKAMKPA